nr:MAG TPA: hypothetical protein [Caudoviricetes sp.]
MSLCWIQGETAQNGGLRISKNQNAKGRFYL